MSIHNKVCIVIITKGNDICAKTMAHVVSIIKRYPRVSFAPVITPLSHMRAFQQFQNLVAHHPEIEWFYFLNADIIPDPSAFDVLCDSGKEIVAAPTWHYDALRGDIHLDVCYEDDPMPPENRVRKLPYERKLEAVKFISLSCVLLNRRVFDEAKGQFLFRVVDPSSPFSLRPDECSHAFCHLTRKMGFDVHVNWAIPPCDHYKTVYIKTLAEKFL